MNAITARRPGEALVDVVDRLPPQLRALVHEYGLSVVTEFVQHGVTKPAAVRQIVRAVMLGAREPGNARPGADQATRTVNALGSVLCQMGVAVPPRHLLRALRDAGYTLVANSPTHAMVEASMATVAAYEPRITKPEKHFRRLQAALAAADRELWGDR